MTENTKTRTVFHIGQKVKIKTNWRSNLPDGRIGIIKSVRRSFHGSSADVSSAIEIKVDLPGGKCHQTFAKYLEIIND